MSNIFFSETGFLSVRAFVTKVWLFLGIYLILSAQSSPNNPCYGLHEGINILQHVYNTYQDIFDDIHIINDQCNSFPMYQNVLTEVNLKTARHEYGGCCCRFLDSFSKLELFIIMNNNALYPREYLCPYISLNYVWYVIMMQVI